MARGEYLLEVRAEEIPARMLPPAIKELTTRLFEDLMARRVPPKEVEATFTPRRLVLFLHGLPEREPDRREEVQGPPASVAFGADGAPTPAGLGFAKRCGVAPEALERRSTEKGEYVVAVREIAGVAVRELLAELVPKALASISWAKTMKWGTGTGPWVRPVHGIVSILNAEVVPFELFGVAAGDSTIGHAILSPRPFRVRSVRDYLGKLERRGVVVRHAERAERLLAGMRARAAAAGGVLVEDPGLLDKLSAICETPGVLEGSFDPRLLALPREVLITSLRDHQSAFTVEREGELLPLFLTVMDRADDPIGRVRGGNEWVVAARLADAEFFFQKDRATPLATRREALAHLTFQEKLGSYLGKSERLERLAGSLADVIGWSAERADAVEAAGLLKADLASEMVKEFTSLQGVMGGIYARLEGRREAVWQAVYDQYLPAAADDAIPRGRAGQLAGLADRLDTLLGMFGLGLIPSGSRDPFGLRRAAQGVVRTLLEGGIDLDLRAACELALRHYGETLPAQAAERIPTLIAFLEERVRYLLGVEGFAYDEIEAGLKAGWRSLPDLRRRVAALHASRERPGFVQVVLAAKRIANIVKGTESTSLSPERLADGAERDLHVASVELAAGLDADLGRGDYEPSLSRIAELAGVLDRFFVDILVMDPDPAVRANRLALLRDVGAQLGRVAALTEMVVDKSELKER